MKFPAVDDMKVFHVGAGWWKNLTEKYPQKPKRKRRQKATKPVVVKPADRRRTEQGFKNRLKKERLYWLLKGC